MIVDSEMRAHTGQLTRPSVVVPVGGGAWVRAHPTSRGLWMRIRDRAFRGSICICDKWGAPLVSMPPVEFYCSGNEHRFARLVCSGDGTPWLDGTGHEVCTCSDDLC